MPGFSARFLFFNSKMIRARPELDRGFLCLIGNKHRWIGFRGKRAFIVIEVRCRRNLHTTVVKSNE